MKHCGACPWPGRPNSARTRSRASQAMPYPMVGSWLRLGVAIIESPMHRACRRSRRAVEPSPAPWKSTSTLPPQNFGKMARESGMCSIKVTRTVRTCLERAKYLGASMNCWRQQNLRTARVSKATSTWISRSFSRRSSPDSATTKAMQHLRAHHSRSFPNSRLGVPGGNRGSDASSAAAAACHPARAGGTRCIFSSPAGCPPVSDFAA